MAYGLRYTFTQKLRDDTSLVVKISEDSYIGDSYSYTPTSITLSPNSNSEDPIGGVISSQLNINFLMSTQSDYDNFPDLLNSNDRKYYVELVNVDGFAEYVKWRGFLFNDYINLAFTTGNQEVNFVCVDALSLLKNKQFSFTSNDINQTDALINTINSILYNIGFPVTYYLYTSCSYYAAGMTDRGSGLQYDPFAQTYQFRRDYTDQTYFDVLENIVTSFGCRLFQYNGDWWIMSLNEMAGDTNYFTKYIIASSSPTVLTSGTITDFVNIQPYAIDNVHFINNNQNKIVRKGYSIVKVSSEFKSAANYINNGTFKQNTGLHSIPSYFYSQVGGTGFVWTYDDPSYFYADVRMNGGSGYASLFMGALPPVAAQTYCPYMGDASASVSFNYSAVSTTFSATPDARVYIILYVGSYIYYLNSSDEWVTTASYITVPKAYSGPGRGVVQNYSKSIPLGKRTNDNLNTAIGYVKIGFYAGNNVDFRINNLRMTQSSVSYNSFTATRQLGSNISLVKEISVPYGAIYPNVDIPPTVGTLMSSSNTILSGWYRYGKTGTYDTLVELLCRQYSNLFNKNIASLEGDLGVLKNGSSSIYIKDGFTVQDSATNAMPFNNKKFLANRLSIDYYTNEITSLQLLEITNTDNASTASVSYTAS